MNIQGRTLTAFLVLSLGVVGLCACTAQIDDTPEATVEDQVARGNYLAFTNGCVDCHTPGALYGAPDFERQLSGSELGWQGEFGVTFGRNLTPDEETGIGSWSEVEIAGAIRTGVRPDGSALLPPMPWPNYSRMTDEDAYAIAAYLKSLPPIQHQVPAAVPPGETPPEGTALLTFPPPPAWDVPREESAQE
jgi:mono/diheme cytochrome c family protein